LQKSHLIEIRMTKDEKSVGSAHFSDFVIRISLVIRHSVFVIHPTHGLPRSTLTFDAGFVTNLAAGRIGLRVSSPPQIRANEPELLRGAIKAVRAFEGANVGFL